MKYFTIKELCRSATAEARGVDNTPTDEVIGNLTKLVDNVLDPVREAWGGPITVNSGYRCEALNAAVGGVADSNHLYGRAADLTVGSKAGNKKLYGQIVNSGLAYDECFGENGFSWVHVAYREGGNRYKKGQLAAQR